MQLCERTDKHLHQAFCHGITRDADTVQRGNGLLAKEDCQLTTHNFRAPHPP